MGDLPAVAREAGVARERWLDVRPILDQGGDPFTLIMRSVNGLASDEALHLIVGFEPKPLYAVLRNRGLLPHTEKRDGVYHVWFYPVAGAKSAEASVPPPGREPLQPVVEVDVRGLEPPQPMIQILEKLVELGAGARLLVQHHREPVLLYEKLALRGYGAQTTRRGEGDYLVYIAPAWSLERG